MDIVDFNVKVDNKWLYRIVEDSLVLTKIMEDIEAEAPELIKVSSKREVKHSIITYVCDPKPFKVFSTSTGKLVRILKRHLTETKEFAEFDRIAASLRGKVVRTVRKLNVTANFEELLGCTSDELITHLEKQFQEGMNWDNHSKKGWHIDHIEPLCSFILTDPEQVKKATHYTNLRPLWAKENSAKVAEDRKKSVRKKKRI